jgi:hypothetical protein
VDGVDAVDALVPRHSKPVDPDRSVEANREAAGRGIHGGPEEPEVPEAEDF